MKFIKFAIAAIVTVALVFLLNTKLGSVPPLGKFLNPFSGFWQNAEAEGFHWEEDIQLAGLHGEAIIKYDAQRIPHIFAENDHDVYFLQGYVTARDRLWQMEMQTHAAAGRISEIVGKETLKYDRFFRRIGMLSSAKNALEKIEADPTTKEILDAYTAGVNTYIFSLKDRDLPIEYKLLDYEPEPWTNLKTALLLKYMALSLSGYSLDSEYTNALVLFGKEMVEKLYPEFPDTLFPIIPKTTAYNFKAVAVDTPDIQQYHQFLNIHHPFTPDPDNGSNNWVVAGKKSASGNPLLGNDPHLGLNLPSLWYQVQLITPEMNVSGASLPGAPGVVIGFNENIAWGETNAERDVLDWYIMDFTDGMDAYILDGEEIPIRKEVEEIKVRGGETIYDTIMYTDFGPVVYDEGFMNDSSKVNMAMSWVAHNSDNELLSIYKLNKGKNFNDFEDALKSWASPSQNFVFISKEGDIAIRQQGKFPVLWPEQGKYISDGSRSDFLWKKYIPFEHNPHTENPERGFLYSANQHPTDSTYPYYYYGTYEYYRNRRIYGKLNQWQKITPQLLMQLQNDNYNLKAAEILPVMMNYLDENALSEAEKEYYQELRVWDYMAEANTAGQAIFSTWYDTLMALTFDEIKREQVPLAMPQAYYFNQWLRSEPDFIFFDDVTTPEKETAVDMVRSSFSAAVNKLDKWKNEAGKDFTWGNYKNATLTHLLRQITPFNITGVQVGGDKNIVNATAAGHGASWRMVVELGDTINAWGVYPGGQSGNPGSPYYGHFVDHWAQGKYYPIIFLKDQNDQSDKIQFTQKILPK